MKNNVGGALNPTLWCSSCRMCLRALTISFGWFPQCTLSLGQKGLELLGCHSRFTEISIRSGCRKVNCSSAAVGENTSLLHCTPGLHWLPIVLYAQVKVLVIILQRPSQMRTELSGGSWTCPISEINREESSWGPNHTGACLVRTREEGLSCSILVL